MLREENAGRKSMWAIVAVFGSVLCDCLQHDDTRR